MILVWQKGAYLYHYRPATNQESLLHSYRHFLQIKYRFLNPRLLCSLWDFRQVPRTLLNKFQAQVLEVGQMASQKFVCEEAYMDGISLKLAANAVPDKEKVLVAYEVVDDSTGKVVAKGTENLGKLRSGKFFKMKFDRVNDCKDKAYTLNFQVTKCDAGNVQIFYTPGTDKGEALVYAGTPIDGIGVMRTLTHRFDLETYIVTLCFAAYIVLFMRWLYKLFK